MWHIIVADYGELLHLKELSADDASPEVATPEIAAVDDPPTMKDALDALEAAAVQYWMTHLPPGHRQCWRRDCTWCYRPDDRPCADPPGSPAPATPKACAAHPDNEYPSSPEQSWQERKAQIQQSAVLSAKKLIHAPMKAPPCMSLYGFPHGLPQKEPTATTASHADTTSQLPHADAPPPVAQLLLKATPPAADYFPVKSAGPPPRPQMEAPSSTTLADFGAFAPPPKQPPPEANPPAALPSADVKAAPALLKSNVPINASPPPPPPLPPGRQNYDRGPVDGVPPAPPKADGTPTRQLLKKMPPSAGNDDVPPVQPATKPPPSGDVPPPAPQNKAGPPTGDPMLVVVHGPPPPKEPAPSPPPKEPVKRFPMTFSRIKSRKLRH